MARRLTILKDRPGLLDRPGSSPIEANYGDSRPKDVKPDDDKLVEFAEAIDETWEPDEDQPEVPADSPDGLTVRHDLSEDERRRLPGFDVFHDPMALLGFIPQAAFVILIAAVSGVGTTLSSRSEPLVSSPCSANGSPPCGCMPRWQARS